MDEERLGTDTFSGRRLNPNARRPYWTINEEEAFREVVEQLELEGTSMNGNPAGWGRVAGMMKERGFDRTGRTSGHGYYMHWKTMESRE